MMNDRAGFEEEYPFESRFFNKDGMQYHYIDEGEGEPLLMVHGNPTWSFAWRNFVRDLSPRYRVIAVDHIGCGFSDKPQGYHYRLEQHVDNLCSLIEHLDLQKITLVAHDWGGAIGMGAATALPDRFSRFVLSNTAAFRFHKIPWRIAVCRIPLFGKIAIRGFNLFARSAIKMTVAKPERMTEAVKAGYLAPYDSWENRIATLKFVEDIPLKPKHSSYETLVDIEEGLAQFQSHPMLLVWGEQDWCFTLEFLEEFQKRFPQAETLSLPDAGHYVFEDAHEQIMPRLNQFLEEHSIVNEVQ
ncbi:Haloalkane dehalogenase-like protein [hydrothermal vent metagenome]|uniref:Haloalkane dehalogenase-like protein n=1 Tax=hydrothermal vent metagenome TaxID=652676 RepID=A0A3B1D9T7_9ZZZZ